MKKVKLGEIADLNKTTFSFDNFEEIFYLDTSSVTKGVFNDFIHLTKNDIIPSRARRAVKDKTIVYSTVRPNLEHYGIFENPKDNIVVSTGFTTIDIKDNLADPKFLYYNLTQNKYTNALHTIATNNVSSYPSINPSVLENMELEFPDLPTQTVIANILSSLDDKIEFNNKINNELEAMAKALYDYWFVQFDFPDKNGKPYKSSGGRMIWNEKLKRNIPEKWDILPLSNYANIINGATPSTEHKDNYGGNIVWITPKDLSDQNNKFVNYGERTITLKGYNSCSTQLLPVDSILLSSRAPIGLLSIAKCELCTNQGFKNIVFFDNNDSYYFYYYILSNMKRIENLGSGTTFKEVSKDDLGSFHVLYPTDKELRNTWISLTKNTFDKQYSVQQENQTLTQLRDFLLPLLMNGQVTIKSS